MSQINASYQFVLDANSDTWIPLPTVSPSGGAAVTLIDDAGNAIPVSTPSASIGTTNGRALQVLNFSHAYNGAAWFPMPAATAAIAASATVNNPPVSIRPGNWCETDAPATDVAATVTKTGVASTTHIVTAISARIMNLAGTADAIYDVNLLSGAVILATWRLMVKADAADTTGKASDSIEMSGLNIASAVGDDVTLEIDYPGGASVVQSVMMSGYSVTGTGNEPPAGAIALQIGTSGSTFGYQSGAFGTFLSGDQPTPFTLDIVIQTDTETTIGLSGTPTPADPPAPYTQWEIFDSEGNSLLGPFLFSAADTTDVIDELRYWVYNGLTNELSILGSGTTFLIVVS